MIRSIRPYGEPRTTPWTGKGGTGRKRSPVVNRVREEDRVDGRQEAQSPPFLLLRSLRKSSYPPVRYSTPQLPTHPLLPLLPLPSPPDLPAPPPAASAPSSSPTSSSPPLRPPPTPQRSFPSSNKPWTKPSPCGNSSLRPRRRGRRRRTRRAARAVSRVGEKELEGVQKALVMAEEENERLREEGEKVGPLQAEVKRLTDLAERIRGERDVARAQLAVQTARTQLPFQPSSSRRSPVTQPAPTPTSVPSPAQAAVIHRLTTERDNLLLSSKEKDALLTTLKRDLKSAETNGGLAVLTASHASLTARLANLEPVKTQLDECLRVLDKMSR
ncbi:hypothetical protein JCM8547_005170 [Rhodosporidiobolus lusitaniae]